jgi:hypothetical protein
VIRAVVESPLAQVPQDGTDSPDRADGPDCPHGVDRAELTLIDAAGHIARKYAAEPGTVYVLRPDRHVCARWRRADAGRVCAALRRAAGLPRA